MKLFQKKMIKLIIYLNYFKYKTNEQYRHMQTILIFLDTRSQIRLMATCHLLAELQQRKFLKVIKLDANGIEIY